MSRQDPSNSDRLPTGQSRAFYVNQAPATYFSDSDSDATPRGSPKPGAVPDAGSSSSGKRSRHNSNTGTIATPAMRFHAAEIAYEYKGSNVLPTVPVNTHVHRPILQTPPPTAMTHPFPVQQPQVGSNDSPHATSTPMKINHPCRCDINSGNPVCNCGGAKRPFNKGNTAAVPPHRKPSHSAPSPPMVTKGPDFQVTFRTE